MDVEHLGGDTKNFGGLFDLGFAPPRQRSAGVPPVADVAVGDGDEFHFMPALGSHGGGAAGLQLAVVRVRPKTNDAQLAVAGGGVRAGEGRRKQRATRVKAEGKAKSCRDSQLFVFHRDGRLLGA